MATAKQKRWRAIFAQRFGGKKSKAKTRMKTRGVNMAKGRRRSSRSSGMGGMSGLLSAQNVMGTIGGAYIAPMVGVSPAIGGAAGSYIIGKKGLMGAAVGYFAAPMLLGLVQSKLSGNTAQSSAVFY